MEADQIAAIYAAVVQGDDKASCPQVTDDASSALWDTLTTEVEEMRGKGYQFEVPSDPGGPVMDDFAGMRKPDWSMASHAAPPAAPADPAAPAPATPAGGDDGAQ